MVSRSNTPPPSSSPRSSGSSRSWSNRWWWSPFRGCCGGRCAGPTGVGDQALLADDPIFSSALGGQEVLVSALEERERVIFLGSVRRDAGANRQRQRRHAVRLVGVGAVADFSERPLGHGARSVQVTFRHDDAK